MTREEMILQMQRLTYHDDLAECYKIRPDIHTNVIQRLGALETLYEELIRVINKYECDEITGNDVVEFIINKMSQ